MIQGCFLNMKEQIQNKNNSQYLELKNKNLNEIAILNKQLFECSEKISIINFAPKINESVLFRKIISRNMKKYAYMALTLPSKDELKIFYFAKIENEAVFKEYLIKSIKIIHNI